MENATRFQELAQRLATRANELRQGAPLRPALTLVSSGVPPSPDAAMDAILRESHCRMIRHYRRRWGYPMQLLIDQACFGRTGPDELADDELERLHQDLERAQECMLEGISFEDAGLLRTRYG